MRPDPPRTRILHLVKQAARWRPRELTGVELKEAKVIIDRL